MFKLLETERSRMLSVEVEKSAQNTLQGGVLPPIHEERKFRATARPVTGDVENRLRQAGCAVGVMIS